MIPHSASFSICRSFGRQNDISLEQHREASEGDCWIEEYKPLTQCKQQCDIKKGYSLCPGLLAGVLQAGSGCCCTSQTGPCGWLWADLGLAAQLSCRCLPQKLQIENRFNSEVRLALPALPENDFEHCRTKVLQVIAKYSTSHHFP